TVDAHEAPRRTRPWFSCAPRLGIWSTRMKLRVGRARGSRARRGSGSLAVTTATLLAVPLASTATPGASDRHGSQIQVPRGGVVVHENAGQAAITVFRAPRESRAAAQVRYITSGDGYNPDTNGPFDCGGTPCTATSYDFTSVKGELDFAPR